MWSGFAQLPLRLQVTNQSCALHLVFFRIGTFAAASCRCRGWCLSHLWLRGCCHSSKSLTKGLICLNMGFTDIPSTSLFCWGNDKPTIGFTPFSGNLSWTCYFIVMRKRSHFSWFFWVRSLAIVSTIIEFFFRWQVLGHVPRKMLEPRIPIDSCRKGLLEGKQLELHLIFGHTQSTRPAAGLLKRCSSTCSAVWRSEGDPWRNSRGSCGVLPVFLTCVRMLRIFFWNIAASESTRFWPLADKKSSRGKANFHLTKDTKAETCRFWKMADSSKMAWPDQPPRLQQWDGCHP